MAPVASISQLDRNETRERDCDCIDTVLAKQFRRESGFLPEVIALKKQSANERNSLARPNNLINSDQAERRKQSINHLLALCGVN